MTARLPRRLTPSSGHYFFGYYDVPAWTGDERKHLFHRVAFADRRPRPEDVAELGLIDLQAGTIEPFATTQSWNFQQGSMLQFFPGDDRRVLFNTRDGSRVHGIVLDLDSGRQVTLSRPIATVSPAGDVALSISFSRLYSFRPGYGYPGIEDPYGAEAAPADDGIFLVDLAAGTSRLLVSLAELWDFCSEGSERARTPLGAPIFELPETIPRILVNHVTFNPIGSRFVALVRFVEGDGWKTAVVTCGTDGHDLRLIAPFSYASHYNFSSPEALALHADLPHLSRRGKQLYSVLDVPRLLEPEIMNADFFLEDGHCLYSPDRRHLIYDSYPFRDGRRHLYVYDLVEQRGVEIGAFESRFDEDWDIRCDLHARFSPGGRQISFDSSHEGFRGIYVV